MNSSTSWLTESAHALSLHAHILSRRAVSSVIDASDDAELFAGLVAEPVAGSLSFLQATNSNAAASTRCFTIR
jgi:hypothetical protein